MSITIEIAPETEARLVRLAERAGKNPALYAAEVVEEALADEAGDDTPYQSALAAMLDQTLEEKAAMHQRARALIIPGRPLPPGKTLEDVISGKWPGDETDEEINAALETLS